MSFNFLVATTLAGWFLVGCGKQPPKAAPSTDPAATVSATPPPESKAPKPNLAFEKLKGKWVRPDGGYIFEIRAVTSDGKLDAGYFNPQPINVSKATASQEGEKLKVFVELRDVNYPGCTYLLTLNPALDRLEGSYYQAAIREHFEVFFDRLKP